MIAVKDAFAKFKSRLELTDREQKDASRRQKEVRAVMKKNFDVDRDLLTGSYARWTKTKPLRDVDIFFVLKGEDRHYRDDDQPGELLTNVYNVLADEYGEESVKKQRRSVSVTFGDVEDPTYRVLSVDVVPAFAKDGHYEIPDTSIDGWTETDPEIHYKLAVDKHDEYSNEWKGLVRMLKKWNDEHDKPVRPSFLLEVMALEIFVAPYGGDPRYEVKGFLATAAERIHDDWPDPAGLGPDVSDSMNQSARSEASGVLKDAASTCARAIQLEKNGKVGEALRTWRDLFGTMFPLS